MKPKETFIELYYYPERATSTCTQAFYNAAQRFETDYTMDCPFNSQEAVRKHIYRENKKRDKRPHTT